MPWQDEVKTQKEKVMHDGKPCKGKRGMKKGKKKAAPKKKAKKDY